MVDLAGSERLLKTQASGRILEEGKAINLSLSALGDVISALQFKKRHVPFRNSKLTQILQDSIGSDSKTLMLVHVSPKEEDICETVSSLRFATRVKSVRLDNEEPPEVRSKKEAEMAELKQKISTLECEHQDVQREIEKLNERLRCLTKLDPLSEAHLEVPLFSAEKLQSRWEANLQNARKSKGASPGLPGFMRPTICSRERTGSGQYISTTRRKKPPVPPKKRKSASVYAESITPKEKHDAWKSEFGSESSMSRTSFANWGDGTDDNTECSQGKTECEIKKVIFPEQEKSPRRSKIPISHGSISKLENIQSAKSYQKNNSSIEDWLSAQMTRQTRTPTYHGKRVLAITIEERSNKCNPPQKGAKCEEKSFSFSTTNSSSDSKKQVHEADSLNNIVVNEINSLFVHALSDTVQFNQKADLNQANGVKLVPEHKEEFTEITKPVNVGTEHTVLITQATQFGEKNIADCVKKDHSGSQKQKKIADEPCSKLSSKAEDLFKVEQKSAVKENIVTITSYQEARKGTEWKFLKTLQMLWASTLLGLGIQSLGLGNDFFNGIML